MDIVGRIVFLGTILTQGGNRQFPKRVLSRRAKGKVEKSSNTNCDVPLSEPFGSDHKMCYQLKRIS
jgi:hypothetical protein